MTTTKEDGLLGRLQSGGSMDNMDLPTCKTIAQIRNLNFDIYFETVKPNLLIWRVLLFWDAKRFKTLNHSYLQIKIQKCNEA